MGWVQIFLMTMYEIRKMFQITWNTWKLLFDSHLMNDGENDYNHKLSIHHPSFKHEKKLLKHIQTWNVNFYEQLTIQGSGWRKYMD
jgi:hypothetical protein